MQISDHKERGANAIARRPSDCFTGVPIKKRRIPFIRQPSPPPQTTSPTEEPEPEPATEQEQQFTTKAESPTLATASPNVTEQEQQVMSMAESITLAPACPDVAQQEQQFISKAESPTCPNVGEQEQQFISKAESPTPSPTCPNVAEQEQQFTAKAESPTLVTACANVAEQELQVTSKADSLMLATAAANVAEQEQVTSKAESPTLAPACLNVTEQEQQFISEAESPALTSADLNVSEQKEQSTLNPEPSSLTATSPVVTEQSMFKIQSPSLITDGPAEFEASAGNSNMPSSYQLEDQETVADGNNKLIESESVLKKQTSDSYVSEQCRKTTSVVSEPSKEAVQKGNESDSLMNTKPKASEISVKEEVQLALDCSSLSDVAVQGTQGVCDEEKLDPCTWNLALTERGSECNNNPDQKIHCARPNLEANRNHWDLNTMMDTWEGTINYSAVVHEVDLGEKRDIEHGIRSHKAILNKSEGSLVDCGKYSFVCRSKLSTLSAPDPQIKNDVLLDLSLSTSSCPQSGPSSETSHTSTPKVDSRNDPSNDLKVSKNMALVGNSGLAGSRIVKSEPLDEVNKQDFQGRPFNFGKGRILKSEPCVGYLQEHSKASLSRDMELIAHGSVKSEPGCGFSEETSQMPEERLRNSDLKIYNRVLPQSSRTLTVPGVPDCTMSLPVASQAVSCPAFGLANSADTSNHSELLANTAANPSTLDLAQKTNRIGGTDVTDSASDLINPDVDKSEVSNGIFCNSRVKGHSVHPSSRVKAMDKQQSGSHGHNDAAESDEEKINLSDDMQDDTSDTDEELDAGRGVVFTENQQHVDDDDDYEDGELREPLVHITSEVGEGPEKDVYSYHEMLDTKEVSVSGCSADGFSPHVEVRDVRIEDSGVRRSSYISEGFDNVLHHNQNSSCTSDHTCLRVLSAVEEQSAVVKKMEPIGELLNSSGKEDLLKVCDNEFSDVTVSTSQGTSLGGEQCSTVNQQDSVNGMKSEETKFAVWSKTESLVVRAEVTKDINNKGNSSRIINLARAFSNTSPGRRSFPGRLLPSRIERERYNDGLHNGDKLHPRGSRDDDGRSKFERQRYQDYPLRSAASEFIRGRGRPEKRFDSPHAAVMVSRDGTVVGSGRKPLRDELPSFRDISSRRRSPGGRGRPVTHGAQVVRRSRDVSPGRCIGRGDSNLIGLRAEKKYMRRLPDDMVNTVFSRSQPQCQQADEHFVGRDRSYSPVRRKGPLHVTRLRSNSPSRARSPGPWSSPRRRSPDAFGRPELVHRRSPPFYRMKRMRSPHQRPIFSEDVDGRRHGSPPYMSRISNDIRDMSASRESDHQRSFVQNRSPSGRVLARGARRFDMMDPREGIENEEYFTGQMHSERFHEIGPDGNADGRRICPDRRRSFRPAYDADVVEKFHFHVEGGPRSYRFSPEADAEFHEGGNMREREFDRRVKNRSGNTPRSTRSGEEHDENYRNGEQGWDAAGFEDVSPAKRRRF